VKLKFVLLSSGQDSRDLVATVDSSTTVGELATYLARADPQRSAVDGVEAVGDGGLTLALVDQNYRVLDVRLTLPESGLRSGVTLAITHRLEPVIDVGRPVAVALIVAGPDSGKEFPLWPGTAYIGRGHGAEIRLSDSSVSRRHAKLVVVGLPAAPEIVDLGSVNGISVGGAEVPRAVLKAGDRVRLGDTEVEVRLTEAGGVVLNHHSVHSLGALDALGALDILRGLGVRGFHQVAAHRAAVRGPPVRPARPARATQAFADAVAGHDVPGAHGHGHLRVHP